MNLTLDDLITRFGEQEVAELSDHVGRGVVDVAVVDKAITDAEELARSYYNAAGLHEVPFDAATVAKMADIAMYRLSEDSATEQREKRYQEALTWFEMLVKHPSMVHVPDDKKLSIIGGARMVRG